MTGGGWTQVFANDFDTTGPDAGWSAAATSSCGGDMLLGGYGNIAWGTLQITVDTDAHAHTEARVATEYWAIDSWDNETGWIDIDGTNLWFDVLVHTNAPGYVCGTTSWGDQTVDIDQTITHSASTLFYSAGSNLDQGSADESFGVDDVLVWIR